FHRPHRSARAKLALARARARCHGAARGREAGPRSGMRSIRRGLAMPPRTDARPRGLWPMLSLAAALALGASAARGDLRSLAPGRPRAGAHDPLSSLVRRMDRYLRRHEVDGVTMDWRYQVSASEEIRQTVVCQLLAYEELVRLLDRPRLRDEVVRHADFL